ncbi:MAG: caspase family protein [Candidatus Sumerlaeia bacterium]|nr:caspase family protein [Candidatus Sumerlaeia bacterium]
MRRAFIACWLLLLGTSLASAQPATPEARWALVVGVNGYREVESLDFAVGDARAVRQALVEHYGFDPRNIVYLADDAAHPEIVDGAPTRDNILYALDAVFGQPGLLEADDLFVFFFSGHGLSRFTALGADGYLLPIEARGDEQTIFLSAVPMRDLRKYAVENLPAERALFLIDACYSGLSGVTPQDARYPLVPGERAPAKFVVTAGSRDEPVFEVDALGHGLFAYAVLEALRARAADEDGDGALTSRELHRWTTARIAALIAEFGLELDRQVPQRSAFLDAPVDVALAPVQAGQRFVREEATQVLLTRKQALGRAVPPATSDDFRPVALAQLVPKLPGFALFVTPPDAGTLTTDTQARARHEVASSLLRETMLDAGLPVVGFGGARPRDEAEALRHAAAVGANYLLAMQLLRPIEATSATGLSWSASTTVAGTIVSVASGEELARRTFDVKVERHETADNAKEAVLFLGAATLRDALIAPAAAHFLSRPVEAAPARRFILHLDIQRRACTPADFRAALEQHLPAGSTIARFSVDRTNVTIELDFAGDEAALRGSLAATAAALSVVIAHGATEGNASLWTVRRR